MMDEAVQGRVDALPSASVPSSSNIDSQMLTEPPTISSEATTSSDASTSATNISDQTARPGTSTGLEPSSARRRGVKRYSGAVSPIPEAPEEEGVERASVSSSTMKLRESDPSSSSSASNSLPSAAAATAAVPSSSTQPSSTNESSLPPPKRTRRTSDDAESKRRGQRMFGLLNSTLTKFKRESEASKASSAAQRRAQVEARLATKLAESEKEMEEMQAYRSLLWEARGIAEIIAAKEAQRKTMRALKRRMASFLWTTTPTPTRREESETSRKRRSGRDHRESNTTQKGGGVFALAPEIPATIPPISRLQDRDGEYPLYFLPGRTLPEQEDLLNEQEDKVDDEIDRLDDSWEKEKKMLLEKLDAVKRKVRMHWKPADTTGKSSEDGVTRMEISLPETSNKGSSNVQISSIDQNHQGKEEMEEEHGDGKVATKMDVDSSADFASSSS